MSNAQKISFITNRLKKVDSNFLEIVHAMFQKEAELNGDEIIGYDVEGNPKTARMIEEKAIKQVEEVKKGNYTTYEDYKKESESWLDPIK